MKISFGLPKAGSRQQSAARTAAPAASQFFDSDAPSVPLVRRSKVTEITNGRMRVESEGANGEKLLVNITTDGQCVIPCSNRLDDVAANDTDERNIEKQEPVELKYGLNLLPNTKIRTKSVPADSSRSPKVDVAGSPACSSVDVDATTARKQGVADTLLVNNPADSDCATSLQEATTSVPTSSHGDSEPAQPTSDAEVAKLILHDLEQQKLREKLFGTDLVEQATKTVPILLRNKDQRDRQEEADSDDAPSYEKVAVDQFGLAMLLGMGFDPQNNTNKPKEYKRRAYDRAGLGADAHMKQNMETLTNTSMMAKLKKDQMYHQSHDAASPGNLSSTWVLRGLYVRVVERGHPYFGQKGVVIRVEDKAVTLDIDGKLVNVSPKGVETVVSLDATKCKVVRQIARHNEKFYIPVATVVQVLNVTKTYAKIVFRGNSFSVSLDDICEGASHGGGSTLAKRRYSDVARGVNSTVMRVCSLWSRREPRVTAGVPRFDNDLMLLAARHLGLSDSEHLWRLSPQRNSGKLPNVASQTRIVYQDGVAGDRDGNQNDIWLGHARFRGYITISLNGPSGCGAVDWWRSLGGSTDGVSEVMRNDVEADSSSCEPEGEDTSLPDTTIFVYPYVRRNSQAVVDTLYKYRAVLEELDVRSLVYVCGATGSSRALRLMGHILRENCKGRETPSAIHRVEEHAWPWMNHTSEDQGVRFDLPLVLDALASAAIIQYTFEKESFIYDHIASELQKLDAKVKESEESPCEELKSLDEAILTRAVNLLILKRNFSQLNCDHIRVFSDFICDRLHRIEPKSIANISFSLGHSKHLDEFWMFMMAKRIQDNPHEFGPDEIAAIMDAYSNACLEDHEFYAVLCQQVARNFDNHSVAHLTVILRALARVRVRDEWLLGKTLERLSKHLNALDGSAHDNSAGREVAYITANCIVAAGDLDYSGDCNFDGMWRLLTARIRQSSFDICAINWLPLAAMTFASRTTLQTFMPVWLRHVSHTIPKLRSKSFVLTIQRRHHLVRHVFKLGILPPQLLPRHAQKVLDDICDREYITGKVPEDYVPESSTFHLEVCACLRALDVAHQREINIVPFVMDIVVPPKKEYRIKSPQICEAHRLSDKARSGQIDELIIMDEIHLYRNKHHQAYLQRKNAAAQSNTQSTASQVQPTPIRNTELPPEPVNNDDVAVNAADFLKEVDVQDYGSYEAFCNEGDPRYESSVALARSLQEELNAHMSHDDHVRAPDDTYQECMIASDAEDNELQAAIAKSLIEM
ncbi:uncharacterized protein BXIN_2145 [Babesia sp. Xinjiang]|uniref:uncharacterized protein n=1 Tax=Babesia sp. Xinjiang TaxID=462227 RepID=UPI000A23E08D|nr:uncharacterized protein BXIN_2145 [Babesia sp. Xinjiang]ORM40426.1 hypothetical protein BXIN_2145 [Babesia sp. Xinjiang]